MNRRKLLKRILESPHNVRFAEFVDLVQGFSFRLDRVRGSHHLFRRSDISEIINIQDSRGEAKPYQIRQFLRIVERYNLKLEDDA